MFCAAEQILGVSMEALEVNVRMLSCTCICTYKHIVTLMKVKGTDPCVLCGFRVGRRGKMYESTWDH